MSTSADRLKHVAAMRANGALEGFIPDPTDLGLQNAYIAGTVSLEEMLTYAQSYAHRAAGQVSCFHTR